jgi:hypothetical protein
MKTFLILSLFLASTQTWAWGKQGHAIINQTAAYLIAESDERSFLREHAFDLEYFSNVPDIIWKQEKTFSIETPQHFMDMEIFERTLKIEKPKAKSKIALKLPEALLLDREEFDKKYPQIPAKAGRSWWRIRELFDLLKKQSQFLADPKMSQKERYELQAKWLVLAGVIGHYVGDLSQPLHCTENYDGQLTGQKGVHSYFEDKMVNALSPKLNLEVLAAAQKLWPKFQKENKELSVILVIAKLTFESQEQIHKLLEIDKSHSRKKKSENAKLYRKIIVNQMALGAVSLANIWSRTLDWKYEGQSFYNFISTPEYITPGTGHTSHIEEIRENH